MGKNSPIEWTNHTFNPWWGCVKVSAACANCYAEAWSKRVGQKVWGPKSPRRHFSDRHWGEPLKWNADARRQRVRARVFCASMADVFEDRRDLDDARKRLWKLIEVTESLDWLLLTKGPHLISELVEWQQEWPQNVWIGATVEDQDAAIERLDHLLAIPARIRFISAEPLDGRLDLSRWIDDIDWVITGGESGPKARPSSPSWFIDLMNQCMASDTAFHFKQWGDWMPGEELNLAKARIEMADDGTAMARVGKKAAGRVLQGLTWDGLPKGALA